MRIEARVSARVKAALGELARRSRRSETGMLEWLIGQEARREGVWGESSPDSPDEK